MEKELSTLSPVLDEKIPVMFSTLSSHESLQDEIGFYIPPSASLKLYSRNIFDLRSAIEYFITTDKTVMLLLGESGSRKSFFCETLIMKKAMDYSPRSRIHLFISLLLYLTQLPTGARSIESL